MCCILVLFAHSSFGRDSMRLTLLAACAAIAATLWLPGEAAQPDSRNSAAANAAASGPATDPTGTPRSAAAAGDDIITFEQYRDWRLNYIDRRRSELAVEL